MANRLHTILLQKIADARPASLAEMQAVGWEGEPPLALELQDGTVLLPSQDEEGNGPGALFMLRAGKAYTLFT